MHIADTKEQAIADVAFGLADWVDYFERVAALPLAPDTSNFASLVDALNASGLAVIGTVEDAIAQVNRLRVQSKGFGTYLLMGHEWADTAATRHSYELFARYVAPEFQGSAATLTRSRDWAAENRPEFIGAAGNAVMSAISKHHEEKAAKGTHV
jgi:limonene 1,2-monooxygenase